MIPVEHVDIEHTQNVPTSISNTWTGGQANFPPKDPPVLLLI